MRRPRRRTRLRWARCAATAHIVRMELIRNACAAVHSAVGEFAVDRDAAHTRRGQRVIHRVPHRDGQVGATEDVLLARDRLACGAVMKVEADVWPELVNSLLLQAVA